MAHQDKYAERIRRTRTMLGLTQHKLASLLQVPQSTIYRWEHGQAMPNFANLEALHQLAAEKDLLPQIFPILDFETVFFCGDVWRKESHEDARLVFLRATLKNERGILARLLTLIAEARGSIVRIAGFQPTEDPSAQNILRVIFTLPEDQRLEDLDEALRALPAIVKTEYPARLAPNCAPVPAEAVS